jgi:hypothetical protein
MSRPAVFSRGGLFFLRYFSSTSPASPMSAKGLRERLPSVEKWKRAWRYFLWVPAIIFVNDHVISISPVNGISMRPTVPYKRRQVLMRQLNPDTNYGKRDWVVLYKFLFKPRRGDIVILKHIPPIE